MGYFSFAFCLPKCIEFETRSASVRIARPGGSGALRSALDAMEVTKLLASRPESNRRGLVFSLIAAEREREKLVTKQVALEAG